MTGKYIVNREPFAALLLGGLIGAGVSLLFAPRSGHETRRRVQDLAEDTGGRLQCYAARGKEKVISTVEKGKQFVNERRSLIASAVEAGRRAYLERRGGPAGEN